MLLGCIGRHGKSKVYRHWKEQFGSKKCIKNVTKTKGIIEKQNHSSKNIFLDAKNDRIDVVIPKRFYASTCLQHQYIIESTRQTPLTPKKKEKVNKDKQRKLLYLTKELKREKKIRNWILLS